MEQLVKVGLAIAQHWQEILGLLVAIPVAFGGLLTAINSLLKFIAPFTSWTWDDHLSDVLGKIIANKIFQKKD